MIKELLKKYKSYPTMMEISQEIEMINDIMNIPHDELLENKTSFLELLDKLDSSHTQWIFSVNSDNKEPFIQFSHFLDKKAHLFWLNKSRVEIYAENIATRFSV